MTYGAGVTIGALYIEKPSDGGYLVSNGRPNPGFSSPVLFACTTIDEALEYIKRSMELETSKV